MEVSIEVDVNCLDKVLHIASGFLEAIPEARSFQMCGIYAKASNISGYCWMRLFKERVGGEVTVSWRSLEGKTYRSLG